MEADKVTSRIKLEDLRAELGIYANEYHSYEILSYASLERWIVRGMRAKGRRTDAQRSHSCTLGIDLIDVGHPPR